MREKSSVGKVVIDEIAEYIQESYPNNESGIVYCFSRKECEQVRVIPTCVTFNIFMTAFYYFERVKEFVSSNLDIKKCGCWLIALLDVWFVPILWGLLIYV